MKDKDPNEEEFNQDDQDNINEADDSFGLPDLDFNTLDDEPDDGEGDSVTEEEAPENTDEPADEPVAKEEEESEPENEVAEDVVEEAAAEDTEEFVAGEYEDGGEEVDAGSDDGNDDGGDGYVPPKPESNAPRIIAALVITILVSGAIWYFAFYRPQKAAEEKAQQEQLAKEEAAKRAAAEKKAAEEAKLKAEQEANAAADADEAASKEAVFATISEPTGRYYIVVGSFIDADMAADLGNKLKAEGVSSTLLTPKGSKKFNRLTLGNYGSWDEAQTEANKLKGEYGEGLWVLKF
jgi:cell division septation protein DedD